MAFHIVMNKLYKIIFGRGVAQSGSAPVLGTGGRKFESCRPDHFYSLSTQGCIIGFLCDF